MFMGWGLGVVRRRRRRRSRVIKDWKEMCSEITRHSQKELGAFVVVERMVSYVFGCQRGPM
jgi:hypothetical protein